MPAGTIRLEWYRSLRASEQPDRGLGTHADVGLYGAEWIVGRFSPCFGNGVEEGALAYIRQTDNTHFEVG